MRDSDRKSGFTRLLFAMLFSAIIAAALTLWSENIYLDSVIVTEYQNGMIYGIDSDDYATTLFCVDPISERGRYYSRDYSDREYRQFCELVVADDGTVFVMQEKQADEDKKAWGILVWDTDKNKVGHGADIVLDSPDAELACFSATGNTVQMLFNMGKADGKTLFRRYVLNGNDIVEAGSVSVGFNCHECYMLDDGRMVFVDAFGRVFYCGPDGMLSSVSDDGGRAKETDGARFCLVGHRLYYKDYLTDQSFMIDLDAPVIEETPASGVMTLPASFDFYNTSYIRYDDDWTLVSVVSTGDGTESVIGYYGIMDKVIKRIRPTDVDALMVFIPRFLICFAIMLPMLLGMKSLEDILNIKSMRGRLGMFALLLIMAVCGLYEYYMQTYIDGYVTRNAINSCSAMAKIKEYDLNKELLDDMLSHGRISPDDDQQIWLTSRYEDMLRYDSDGMLENMSFHVLYPSGTEIYSADPDLRYNLPLYMIAGRTMQDMVENALESDTVQSGKLAYDGNKVVVVFVPGTTASGHRYVLEAYMTIDEIIVRMQQMNRRMSVLVFIVGIGIVLGICAVIAYCLRPLSYLKDAVMKVAEGQLGAQARVVGHNEVASTVISFNRMSQILKGLNGVVDSYRQLYEAFVPMKLCEKLSGKDDMEISLEPGSAYSGDAYVMSMKVQEDESGESLSEFYDELLKTCTDNGGIASTLAGKQRIVFCDRADDAVQSATAILQHFEGKRRIHISINSAETTVYVLGSSLRRSMTVSRDADEEIMERLAAYVDVSLLVSESVMKRLQEEVPGKYHSRYLGRLSIDQTETSQAVYEIFDGEPQKQRELKLMTAAHFEKGVRAYEKHDMFTARAEMIRVKMDYPKDRVARGYILCCDRKEPPEICRAEG